jgi:ribosomal protein S18 acetylase RimI-like enzyme
MIDPVEAAAAFDAAFRSRAPAGLSTRQQTSADDGFLRALFLATSPVRDLLPGPMLAQQADLQAAAFRNNFPAAMRRIVEGPDGPIGRIIVDWNQAAGSHCADIAVLPTHGGRGVGTALLKAWIEVAARHGLACTLNVAPDNPARALYARLGFTESADAFASPSIDMSRPPGP